MARKKADPQTYPRGEYTEERISGLLEHVESKKLKEGERNKTFTIRTHTPEDAEFVDQFSAAQLGEMVGFARQKGFVPILFTAPKRRSPGSK